MLDTRYIREDLAILKTALANRGARFDLKELLDLDVRWRGLQTEIQGLRQTQNEVSKKISELKRNKESADGPLEEMKGVKARITGLQDEQAKLEERRRELMLSLPNLPHVSVPVGRDAAENKEVRKWGEAPKFSFRARPHWDLGEGLGILDFGRAAKITGSRFVVYRGVGALLERALINFMLDLHVREHGYQEVIAPYLVNRQSMTGTGQLPKFEDDLFRLKDEDYYLIPTAEVSLTNLHRDEILSGHQLPIAYASYSACFRREAGSYGKDVRGMIRQHQFNKVELVRFCRPEDSYDELEKLLLSAETVLRKLKIHYRVVELCTGDLGFSAAKTYDIEVWLPSEAGYREISSCSNFEDFQARRCAIRYRPVGGKKAEYVHTLNGSGLAIGRTVIAILDNYQQEDGSVAIPEALRDYMRGLERIEVEKPF